jgi:hypothetical protein
MLNGYFVGKKTYIMGCIGIITAIATYLTGGCDSGQLMQVVLTSLMGMTLRHGIETNK